MSKKIPVVVVAALMFLTAAVTLIVTVKVYTKEYNKIIGDLPSRAAQYASLQEADELIRANYYGEFIGGSLDESIISGLVQSIGDPECKYFSSGAYKQYLNQLSVKNKAASVTYSQTDKIGYVRIAAFLENTAAEFREALDSFDPAETDGIVLDLRNVSGGSLEIAVQVIDLIVPLATEGNGAIAVTKNAAGETLKIYSANADSVSFPLAVLINSNTSGAAELMACDLRDFGKARLFGETTAGHATVQEVFPMSDGSALRLTVCEMFPYLSGSFQNEGVKPDTEIFLSDADKNALFSSTVTIDDTQYAAAAAYLAKD